MSATGERRPPARAVTRADVAKYAGVSTAVVSYVVNNGPRPVAPGTASRVRDAITVLGYQPNASARALKLGTAGLLGLLVPDTGNPFFAEYALAIEQAAAARGLALLIANSDSDVAVEARLIADLSSRQLDGIIVAGAAGPPASPALRNQLSARPVVFVDTAERIIGCNTLGADKYDGARKAVDHLLHGHGHQAVGLLMGKGALDVTDERELGWRDALRAAGRAEDLIDYARFTRLGGYLAGQRLLAGRSRPTAVFATSDLLAVGLLRAAHEAGLAVPQDLAVVSFDGTQQAEYCWPPLTTVKQPIAAMAQAAVATVIDPPASSHQLFPVDLEVRTSCGCHLDQRGPEPTNDGRSDSHHQQHPIPTTNASKENRN